VSEACSNAVLHAYRDRPPGRMEVAVDVVDHTLVATVADVGLGLRPRSDSPGLGVGLQVIARLADEVRIGARDPGAEVRMTFRLASDS